MDLTLQKRLAAKILGVGVSRIWIDPEQYERVADAITTEDVKRLIKDGVIREKPESTPSRGRWRIKHEKRKRGRRRGHGKRKGKKTARTPKKEVWMNKVRAMRRFLRYLRDKEIIERREYRRLYRLVKGGYFKSLAQLRSHVEEKILARR